MADNRTYKAKRGEIKYMVVTIKDDLGRSVDLTGYIIDFVVTPKDTQTALFSGPLTPHADQVANTGLCSYRLQESDTISADPERYDLELKIVAPTGEQMMYPLVNGASFGTFDLVQSKMGLY